LRENTTRSKTQWSAGVEIFSKLKALTLQQRSIPELPLRLNGDNQRMRYDENRIQMEVNGKETDSDKKVKNLIACHTIR